MAAIDLPPFCGELSGTTGDGALTLAGRNGNYLRFDEAGVPSGTVLPLSIRNVIAGVTVEWEYGLYTYTVAGDVRTLTIVGTPDGSSNAGAKVAWSAGNKQIAIEHLPMLRIRDDRHRFVDPADYTRAGRIDVGGVTAGQTRVQTWPDRDVTLVGNQNWERIAAQALSGSSADFTDLSAFRTIRVWGHAVFSADGTGLWLRTDTNNGASFDDTASAYTYEYQRSTGGTVTGNGAADTKIILSALNVGNDTGEAVAFNLMLTEFNQSAYMYLSGTTTSRTTAGAAAVSTVGGWRTSSGPRNAFQLLTSSSTFAGGWLNVAGIRG